MPQGPPSLQCPSVQVTPKPIISFTADFIPLWFICLLSSKMWTRKWIILGTTQVMFYYKENCYFRAMEPDLKILKAKNALCSPSLCWMDVLSHRAALSHHPVPWAPAPSFTSVSWQQLVCG